MIIYKITNLINNKCYIGQTKKSIEKRFAQHKKPSNNTALANAIKKYGIENFVIEQIDSASSLEELNKKETEYIKKYSSMYPDGYNLNVGGDSREWSDESKKKLSLAHSGKILTQEHKEAIKIAVNKKRQENPEKFSRGAKIMQDLFKKELQKGYHPKRGKKISEESRRRISEAKIGSKNPMFGKQSNQKQKQALVQGQQKRLENLPIVKCHQNGVIYNSVTDAAKALGVGRSSVSNVLIGFRKSCKGYTFEYVDRKSHE